MPVFSFALELDVSSQLSVRQRIELGLTCAAGRSSRECNACPGMITLKPIGAFTNEVLGMDQSAGIIRLINAILPSVSDSEGEESSG